MNAGMAHTTHARRGTFPVDLWQDMAARFQDQRLRCPLARISKPGHKRPTQQKGFASGVIHFSLRRTRSGHVFARVGCSPARGFDAARYDGVVAARPDRGCAS